MRTVVEKRTELTFCFSLFQLEEPVSISSCQPLPDVLVVSVGSQLLLVALGDDESQLLDTLFWVSPLFCQFEVPVSHSEVPVSLSPPSQLFPAAPRELSSSSISQSPPGGAGLLWLSASPPPTKVKGDFRIALAVQRIIWELFYLSESNLYHH